jgi:hypothetical protein
MKPCAAKSLRNLAPLLVLGLLLSTGCASRALWRGEPGKPLTAESLHPWLDRYLAWRSLSTPVKLQIIIPGDKFTAKGHLLYINGESYEIGFVKPYNRLLGNFYITPGQLVYWDVRGFPRMYGSKDTVRMSELVPIGLPNWDPRDLLPFPVSGPRQGFQPDSTWHDGGATYVTGGSGDATYTLKLNADGTLAEEVVNRPGFDVIRKQYQRVKIFKSWPIATRVVCSNASGDSRFIWSLNGILIDAFEFHSGDKLSNPSKLEPSHVR